MKETLKENLLPLYKELLNKITVNNDIYSFCMQWGSEFPKEENSGILFVGKATNGWITPSREVEVLFGTCDKRIFARGDQMKWVSNLENNKKGYNTRNSAFWRVIKRVSQFKNGKEDWSSKVAWSNLYKVSLEKGNPTIKLKRQQESICKEILKTELKILKPKYVIFLTSGWERNFVKHLIKDLPVDQQENVKWGDKYTTHGYLIDEVIFITTSHPQGKNENDHVNAIKKIISRFEQEKKPVPNTI